MIAATMPPEAATRLDFAIKADAADARHDETEAVDRELGMLIEQVLDETDDPRSAAQVIGDLFVMADRPFVVAERFDPTSICVRDTRPEGLWAKVRHRGFNVADAAQEWELEEPGGYWLVELGWIGGGPR